MTDAALMAIDPAMRWTAARLADGSIQGALLIVLVWVLCRTVTAIPPRVRAMLWWVASLKLVLALVPLPGLPLRVLPPVTVRPEETVALTAAPRSLVPPAAPVADPVSDASAPPDVLDELPLPRVEQAPASRSTDIPWLPLLVGIWCVVVSVHGALLVVSHRRVSSLVRRGARLSAEQEDEVQQLARRIGLRRPPLVLVSDGITSPQAVGLSRRCILLPVAFAERVTPAEWRMALCHELMHLRRRDLLFGWVPAIAERLFFFHPLARLASEQYLLEREAACDAAVVHALNVDAHDYGRMLLRLGVSRAMPGFAVSGSSPTVSLLRRRLEMLQHATATAGTSRAQWLVAAAAIVLVPFHLAARTPESIPAGRQIAVASAAPIVAARGSQLVVPPNRVATRDVVRKSQRAEAAAADAQAGTSADRQRAEELLAQSHARRLALQEQLARQREAEGLEQLTFDPFQLTQDLQTQSVALDEMRRLLERREALAQVYNPSHPDMRKLDAELKRFEALVPPSKLAELQASQAGTNVTANDEARERALRAELEALKARLQELEANQRIAKGQSTAQFLTGQIVAEQVRLMALGEARQKATDRDDQATIQSLNEQIKAGQARLAALQTKLEQGNFATGQDLGDQRKAEAEEQALDAQLKAAAKALQKAREVEVKAALAEVKSALAKQRGGAVAANSQNTQQGPNTPAQLSATIEREKANIARQQKLLEDAKLRLAAAEEKLRASQQPVTPQQPKR